jgi:hypothetical protein
MLSYLCQGLFFKRKLLMAHINKTYRFIENTSKMTYPEKKDI